MLLIDALLEGHHQPILLAGQLRLIGVEDLQRQPALDDLLLEDVERRVRPLFTVRLDLDVVLPGPTDARPPYP
ncbi:hypothetical protein GCM10020001_052470 [Nonomuraea salmonea]